MYVTDNIRILPKPLISPRRGLIITRLAKGTKVNGIIPIVPRAGARTYTRGISQNGGVPLNLCTSCDYRQLTRGGFDV